MALDVLVLSDTHLRTGSPRWLPASVSAELGRADAVLHAGDVLDAGVLERLASEAGGDVHAVLGNNDLALTGVLPARRVVDLAGVRIGMVHDSGRTDGRPGRMHRLFPDCRVVVFGHSHAPAAIEGVAGQLLFNPGSPTERRLQPAPTFGRIRLDRGEVVGWEVLEV